MMKQVIKREELKQWIIFKKKAEFMQSADYQSGYIDALDNLWQDINEGRVPTYLFEGQEGDSIIL